MPLLLLNIEYRMHFCQSISWDVSLNFKPFKKLITPRSYASFFSASKTSIGMLLTHSGKILLDKVKSPQNKWSRRI